MSFGAIANDYDRLRSGPPRAAVDWLLPQRRDVVVDLGAGTGLLTRAIAPASRRVVAVEPDGRMRSVLAARSPGVEVGAGRGEAIPLPDESADAVLVSSAWHWMDPQLAVPEIARVLRDGGRFGIISTGRERSIPWLQWERWFPRPDENATRLRAAAEHDQPEDDRRQMVLPAASPFGNIETCTFRFTRNMTVPDLLDWMGTYSWVITASDEEKTAGRAVAAASLADQFPGASEIEVPMRSRCWRADRARRD
jgi:SAM-dependent methyltransferase